MGDLNKTIFNSLFKQACEKCFGFPLISPLSEADSRLLSNKILEHTGLVIGAKTLRNYSLYVLQRRDAKVENPSVATLDTLARYVLDAPYTDEAQRKDAEGHYPYWFQYRSKFSNTLPKRRVVKISRRRTTKYFVVALAMVIGLFAVRSLMRSDGAEKFTDHFDSVSEDSLKNKGWIIKSLDTTWWKRRNEKTGHLSLYTIRGDNWPNAENPAGIRNLLMRRVVSECFTTEIHLTNFFPKQNWQQAGMLLSEDSALTSKALRLSISYNDFFGGYEKLPEVIIQAVSSAGNGGQGKPEEITHTTLFTLEPGQEHLVENNLARAALRIEKKGNRFRFLYTTGTREIESFAFKEILSGDFNIQPKYVSLFAIQGWADDENSIPAQFDSFVFESVDCGE